MSIDEAILDVRFARPIPENIRLLIVSSIWGPTTNTPAEVELLKRRSVILSAYFEFYHKKAVLHTTCKGHSSLNTHRELLFFISLLKANPTCSREVLRETCVSLLDGDSTGAQTIATIPTTALPEFVPWAAGRDPLDIDTALAVAVRTMLALNISPDSGPNEFTIATGQSNVIWNANETLAALVDRNFPKVSNPTPASEVPIKLGNLRARSLQDHFGIKLEWTRHFPDHLKLDIGTKSKSLKVFELASVLEVSCSVTKGKAADLATSESLKLGCLPPSLLHQTQKTLELLFPPRDWSWLQREIDPRNSWLHGNKPGLDSRLSSVVSSVEGVRNQDMGAQSVTNSKQLFEKYPYWASRLYAILEEVDNPTPLSWFGKWAERRRAARHTFRLTYLGIVIAVLFGMAATGLAAVSVWISYCGWQGDISWACQIKSSSNRTASTAPSN